MAEKKPKGSEDKVPDDPNDLHHQKMNLLSIREVAEAKRVLLWNLGQYRSKRRKRFNVLSGTLAMVSGGAATALFFPVTELVGMKVASAGLAFASGFITLITNNFFGDRETSKIYQGAGAYGDLRDRAGVALNRPGLTVAQAHAAFERLTEQSGKLMKEYDQLVDEAAMARVKEQVREEVEAYDRQFKPIQPPDKTPLREKGEARAQAGGPVFVSTFDLPKESGPTIFSTPIRRDW